MHWIIQFGIGLLGLGFLVTIHEFGHFWVAKKNGVKVLTFSIGFGKKLLKWKRGETTYCISMIPFGGYVAMAGENPGDDTPPSPRDFAVQSIPVRAAIAFGGPAVNIVFAFVLLFAMYWAGLPESPEPARTIAILEKDSPAAKAGLILGDSLVSMNGKTEFTSQELQETVAVNIGSPITFQVKRGDSLLSLIITPTEREEFGIGYAGMGYGLTPKIGDIPQKNSPAAEAGLKVGDIFLKANGKKLYSPMDLSKAIKESKGDSISLEIRRGSEIIQKSLVPKFHKEEKRYLIGILFARPQKVIQDRSFSEAALAAWDRGLDDASKPFVFLSKIFQGQIRVKAMSGPVGIMQTIGYTVQIHEKTYEAIMAFLLFMAMISMNLGIMNLLPLAITDGGILMFLGLEAVRGRPLSKSVQYKIQQVFFVLFLSFFVYITFQDILRVSLFSN